MIPTAPVWFSVKVNSTANRRVVGVDNVSFLTIVDIDWRKPPAIPIEDDDPEWSVHRGLEQPCLADQSQVHDDCDGREGDAQLCPHHGPYRKPSREVF